MKVKKKKTPQDFLVKKMLKKKLGLDITKLRKYRRLHTYIHTYIRTYTHRNTYKLFLKTGFLVSWGLKTCLYAKNSKIKISPKTMVPL